MVYPNGSRPMTARHNEVAMKISLYALTCGHIEGEFGRLMEGGEGKSRCRSRSF
jgi:hypothetical protein